MATRVPWCRKRIEEGYDAASGCRRNAKLRGTAGAASEVAERESARWSGHIAAVRQLSAFCSLPADSRLPARSARRFRGSGLGVQSGLPTPAEEPGR
jgi:hypothetical protein